MGLHRECLDALAHQRHLEVRVGAQHHLLFLEPGVGISRNAGEGGHGRQARHGEVAAQRQAAQTSGFERELDLLVLGGVVAADHADLEVGRVRAVADAYALAFQEAIGQPAAGVAAHQAVEGVGAHGHGLDRCRARPQALARQLAEHDAVVHRGAAAGKGGLQRDGAFGDGVDHVVAVEARARAADAQQLAGEQTVVLEAAQVAADTACERAHAAGVGQHQAAAEQLRAAQATDGLQHHGHTADAEHVGQAIGQHGDLHVRRGLLRQAQRVVVGGAGAAHQLRAAAAFLHHHAGRVVVHHLHAQLGHT